MLNDKAFKKLSFLIICIFVFAAMRAQNPPHFSGTYAAVSIIYKGDSLSLKSYIKKLKETGNTNAPKDFGLTLNFLPNNKVAVLLYQYSDKDSSIIQDTVGYKIKGNQVCLMESKKVGEHSCLDIIDANTFCIPFPSLVNSRCYLRRKG